MYSHVNPKNDKPSPLIAEDVYKIIVEVGADGHVQLCSWACSAFGLIAVTWGAAMCRWRLSSSRTCASHHGGVMLLTETLCLGAQNGEKLDSVIIYDRDFDYDYFGFKVRTVYPASFS